MTRHLDEIELVDALDGPLGGAREVHLQQCSRCTDRLARLREATIRVRDTGDVPDPSPLFWEAFSRRVHEAVRNERTPASSSPWWLLVRIAALSAAAAVMATGVTFFVVKDRGKDVGPAANRAPAAVTGLESAVATEPSQAGTLEMDSDTDWGLVRTIADDLRWEDALEAGIQARPGSADVVAAGMSAAERQELAQLLEDELKRSGA